MTEPFPKPDIHPGRFNDEYLDRMRQRQEPLGDAAFLRILQFRTSDNSLFDALRIANEKGIPECVALWEHVHDVPRWVDPPRMQPAISKALNHVIAGGLALLGGSLVESYAGAFGAKVLIRTGRLEHDTSKRIYETARFVASIATDGGALPGTDAHRYIVEVRLIHAAIRASFRNRDDWDDAWGLPINQEDYVGTLLLFSLVFRRALNVLGVEFSHEERDGNQHVYRWVGHAMGVDEDLLPKSLVEESQLYSAISHRQYTPDEDSRALASALLDTMSMRPPFLLPRPMMYALSRAIIGDALADQLCFPDGDGFDVLLRSMGHGYRAKNAVVRGPLRKVGKTLGIGVAEGVLLAGLKRDYFTVFRKRNLES